MREGHKKGHEAAALELRWQPSSAPQWNFDTGANPWVIVTTLQEAFCNIGMRTCASSLRHAKRLEALPAQS
jgi:hypothetical protein